MKSCLSTIVKSVMQTQTSITFGCLQLQHDHYLAHACGLPQDAIQQLRHAPALDPNRLFHLPLMQTKALLPIFSASSRKNCNDRGRVSRRGTRHRESHVNNYQPRDYQLSSFEHEPPTTSTSRIPTTTGAAVTSTHSIMKCKVTTSVKIAIDKIQKPALPCYKKEREALVTLLCIPDGCCFFWREWRRTGASERVCRWLRRISSSVYPGWRTAVGSNVSKVISCLSWLLTVTPAKSRRWIL